jgi:hypothetical protein
MEQVENIQGEKDLREVFILALQEWLARQQNER